MLLMVKSKDTSSTLKASPGWSVTRPMSWDRKKLIMLPPKLKSPLWDNKLINLNLMLDILNLAKKRRCMKTVTSKEELSVKAQRTLNWAASSETLRPRSRPRLIKSISLPVPLSAPELPTALRSMTTATSKLKLMVWANTSVSSQSKTRSSLTNSTLSCLPTRPWDSSLTEGQEFPASWRRTTTPLPTRKLTLLRPWESPRKSAGPQSEGATPQWLTVHHSQELREASKESMAAAHPVPIKYERNMD